jgi:hypothetical protein
LTQCSNITDTGVRALVQLTTLTSLYFDNRLEQGVRALAPFTNVYRDIYDDED